MNNPAIAAAARAAAQAFAVLAEALEQTPTEVVDLVPVEVVEQTTEVLEPISIEAVRVVMAEKVKQGLQAEVKALIGSFGVTKLTEVPADKRAELLAGAESLGNA